jgi:trehalose 6-phosphate phosphatase
VQKELKIATTLEELIALVQSHRQTRRLLIGLDYDGTMAEIAPRPELARPTLELLQILTRLVACPDYAVVIISGRPLPELQQLLPVPGLNFLGSHGAEGFIEGSLCSFAEPDVYLLNYGELTRQITLRLADLAGWWLESKPLGLALHYRQASPEMESRILGTLEPWLTDIRRQGCFQVLYERKAIEILPRTVSKGQAFTGILLSPCFSECYPLYCGDDVTDESVFHMLQGRGLTVKVGTTGEGTQADYFLADPVEVRRFLALLAAQKKEKP